MKAIMHCPDSDSGELIIVGGPYKSGTSNLCAAIEAWGYGNPACITNPQEQGQGLTVSLYETRECSVARAWNRTLITSGTSEANCIERRTAFYLIEMTYRLGARLVIKDPYMKLTAPHWAHAARRVGIQKIRVVIAVRDPQFVRRSQERSRFMRWQLRKHPDVFRQMSAPLDRKVYNQLHQHGCSVQFWHYENVHGNPPPVGPFLEWSRWSV